MKSFFGSLFIDKSQLEELECPMKLEYYKTSKTENNRTIYGVEIVVIEYRKDRTYVEAKEVGEISLDEKEIEYLLQLFKDNVVTPVSVEYIIEDYMKETYNLEEIACS